MFQKLSDLPTHLVLVEADLDAYPPKFQVDGLNFLLDTGDAETIGAEMVEVMDAGPWAETEYGDTVELMGTNSTAL